MRKLLVIFVLSSSAALLPAGTALATPPEMMHFTDSGSEPGFIHCDGYAIDLATSGTVDVTAYFDRAGDLVKFLARTRVRDVFTNTVTGKIVVNRGVFQETFTRIRGTDEFTQSLTGFRFMGTSPGEGVVLQDVGRIEYVGDEEEIVFLAGQHHIPDDENAEDVFCAALA
jgi:hypothetical protein